MTILTTARLRLEPCANVHLDGLHAMNADPQVMRYISGKAETRDETQAMIDRVQARWAEFGYSWWTFIELGTDESLPAGERALLSDLAAHAGLLVHNAVLAEQLARHVRQFQCVQPDGRHRLLRADLDDPAPAAHRAGRPLLRARVGERVRRHLCRSFIM